MNQIFRPIINQDVARARHIGSCNIPQRDLTKPPRVIKKASTQSDWFLPSKGNMCIHPSQWNLVYTKNKTIWFCVHLKLTALWQRVSCGLE